ncbi:NAD-dependent epimerase/dehydratase family protein [Nocardia stercoris]|uniref:NAD-dependent epimerase/dehydratase family protein n=1 Tax=Nocardia stercoris TaxID=2483361 RepID=A0A3M2KZL0_9NOCA|nr:NAD-dependent epimerase/dehydratase family protein [Nocardia stercoris]RMI29703.1 NAD-dependent epimerase/dehydratase family protein [Nocardia stercoris]
MKVAVTGAAGFVGANLVDQLVGDGHEVVAIDRVANQRSTSSAVTWVNADILDPNAMRTAFADVETVYHLVAVVTLRMQDPVAWRINTEGVATVARAALDCGVRRFVHLSSVHAFDQAQCGKVLSEATPRSIDPEIPVYDRSKWAGEQELRKVIDDGLDATICNPTGIWGPADYLPRLSRLNGLARSAAKGRVPAFISGVGFDLVDVRDVAAGMILAAEKGRTGENYLLGGEFANLIEWMRQCARSAGRRGPLLGLPLSALEAVMPIAEPIGAKFNSDIISKAALGPLLASPLVDHSKAANELGYTPRTLERSVRDFISFLVESGQM